MFRTVAFFYFFDQIDFVLAKFMHNKSFLVYLHVWLLSHQAIL